MVEKVCSKCKCSKSLDDFYARRRSVNGYSCHCKSCVKAAATKRYKANPERARAKVAKWKKENPEKVNANNAKWRKANPEKMRKAVKNWRKKNQERYKATSAKWQKENIEKAKVATAKWQRANPEKIKANNAKWQRENPEKVRAHGRRRRALKLEVAENFTADMANFTLGFWGKRCAACGATKDLAIDHWQPLSRGFALDMSNAVVLCRSCNSKKHDRIPGTLYSPLFIRDIEFRLCDQEDAWLVEAG